MSAYGSLLRAYRSHRGLSQRRMAKELGMDNGNYARLETSQMPPPETKEGVLRQIKPLEIGESAQMEFFQAALEERQALLALRFWGVR